MAFYGKSHEDAMCRQFANEARIWIALEALGRKHPEIAHCRRPFRVSLAAANVCLPRRAQ
jgi:hypothetical protein